MSLLEFTERGIYCQKAGVFIDPWKSVPRALITHGHSDHACGGCQHYLSTPVTGAILKFRLGSHIGLSTLPYGKTIQLNDVTFSFHPAGHIPGSAQVKVESKGEIWVVSGDYKRDKDSISEEFEPVKCHTFITESTFGLPVYCWPDPRDVYQAINTWWNNNKSHGVVTVLTAYSLGKAQRLIQNLDHSIGPVYCHPAVQNMNKVIRDTGRLLKTTYRLDESKVGKTPRDAIVILPSLASVGALGHNQYATGAASGWMILRGRKRWQNIDRGFVISDHVDWPALNNTISDTRCERVIVTHGYKEQLARWLHEKGYQAQAENTTYEGETL